MPMPKDEMHSEFMDAWRNYVKSFELSLQQLEADIKEASEMADICTEEWCVAIEHVIDELSNSLFSISEPRWSDKADSAKLKQLKRRVHDLYADYRAVNA